MSKKEIADGVVHKVPADLRKAITADRAALAKWEDITPLARNEWICWVESVKTNETRRQHIERTVEELKEGMRRPCCWMGCIHRRDKPLSPSQKFILGKLSKKQRDWSAEIRGRNTHARMRSYGSTCTPASGVSPRRELHKSIQTRDKFFTLGSETSL